MTITLTAQIREIPTKAMNQQRQAGKIPAVLYGRQQASRHLFVEQVAFEKIFKIAGESSLVDLVIDNQPAIKVLTQDIQKDPLTGLIHHVDFYQIDMSQPFNFKIPLVFSGESKAVKELEGTLVKSLDEIEISCLPADLPHEIEVDISSLQTFDDLIRVKDLKIPSKITVKTEPTATVASVARHFVEVEPVAEAAAPVAEGEATVTEEKAAAEPETKETKS